MSYQPGEIVDITIKGARVIDAAETAHRAGSAVHEVLVFRYADDSDETMGRVVYTAAKGVSVERVAPAEWPPQPGDLWRDRDGTLWFAVEEKGHHPAGLMCDSSQVWNPAEVGANWSPLTLVHREDDGEVSEP